MRRIEQYCLDKEALAQLFNEIPKLPPWEALIIILWCGLHDGKAWTLRKLAKRFNVSESQINQIKNRGLERLRAGVR